MNKLLCTLLILFSISIVNSQSINSQKFTVVIDPGHGGYDSGTTNKTGNKEKDINLYVSKYIKYYIEKYSTNIAVILTREKDIFLPLKNRPIYGRVSKADLFISIHCNHNQNSNAKGIELYIQKTNSENAKMNLFRAKKLCGILDKNFVQKLNYKSRGILENNFQVLRESIEYLPSILIEMGFFSNKDEGQYLTSKKGINGISLTIAKSIIDYFEK